MTEIYAHRGAAGTFPENTMISFEKGKKFGADGIELDVHLTKDNKLVVIHDETIDRTSDGKGFISTYTYNQLQNYDVSYKWRGKIEKCHIPLLEEVFEWLKGNNLNVNIELKNNLLPYISMEERVIQLIRIYELEKRVILSSFNPESIKYCASIAPDIETAILLNYSISEPWEYAKKFGAKGIHPKYTMVDRMLVSMCQKFQIAVRPYTVNKIQDMRKLIDFGCNAIITDYPEKLKEIKQSLKS